MTGSNNWPGLGANSAPQLRSWGKQLPLASALTLDAPLRELQVSLVSVSTCHRSGASILTPECLILASLKARECLRCQLRTVPIDFFMNYCRLLSLKTKNDSEWPNLSRKTWTVVKFLKRYRHDLTAKTILQIGTAFVHYQRYYGNFQGT